MLTHRGFWSGVLLGLLALALGAHFASSDMEHLLYQDNIKSLWDRELGDIKKLQTALIAADVIDTAQETEIRMLPLDTLMSRIAGEVTQLENEVIRLEALRPEMQRTLQELNVITEKNANLLKTKPKTPTPTPGASPVSEAQWLEGNQQLWDRVEKRIRIIERVRAAQHNGGEDE